MTKLSSLDSIDETSPSENDWTKQVKFRVHDALIVVKSHEGLVLEAMSSYAFLEIYNSKQLNN